MDIYSIIDDFIFPREIDSILEKASCICPVMKEDNRKIYPENIARLFPNKGEEFNIFVAQLFNELAKYI